jgi:hypothetical protein
MVDELREYGVRLDRPDKVPDEVIHKLWSLVCRGQFEAPEDPHGTPRQFAERVARHWPKNSPAGIPRRASLLALTPLGKCVLQGQRYHRPGT